LNVVITKSGRIHPNKQTYQRNIYYYKPNQTKPNQTKPNQTKPNQNETKQKTMSMINKTTNTQGRIDVTGGTYCFVDCNILYIF
jgi:hypothetical protein